MKRVTHIKDGSGASVILGPGVVDGFLTRTEADALYAPAGSAGGSGGGLTVEEADARYALAADVRRTGIFEFDFSVGHSEPGPFISTDSLDVSGGVLLTCDIIFINTGDEDLSLTVVEKGLPLYAFTVGSGAMRKYVFSPAKGILVSGTGEARVVVTAVAEI